MFASAPVRSATNKVDWTKLYNQLGLDKETLSALQAFRARNINASNKNAALKSTMPQLDLSHYKSILKNASAVEAAEKALSSFKPVDYDVSKWDKVVDAFEQKAVSQAKETVQKVDKEETDLKATLSNITEARPFEDLTSDEAAAANPEISKATEAMLKNGRWTVPGYTETYGVQSLL